MDFLEKQLLAALADEELYCLFPPSLLLPVHLFPLYQHQTKAASSSVLTSSCAPLR